MEQAKKQRLVGAIVLAALALILVPGIFDFSQNDTVKNQRQEIPDAPDTRRMEVLPLAVWSSRDDPQIDPANRIIDTPTPVAEPVVEVESVTNQPEVKLPEKKPEPKPQNPVSKPQSVAKPDSVKLPVVPEGAAAWVVQIGSFADEAKAFALRDRLRKADHPVFIERSRSKGKLIYRVKIGPMLQRDEALRRKQQVAKLTKLDGLIMKYR